MNVKNSKGMTLIEIVVAIGVMGLMATVFASSFSEIFKAQKMIEKKDRANDFSSSFGRFLMSPSACTSSLRGKIIPSNIGGETSIIISKYRGYGADEDSIELGSGTEIEPNILRVKDIFLRKTNVDPQQIFANKKNRVRRIVNIKLELEVNSKGQWAAVAPRYWDIPVYTEVGEREIVSCALEMEKDDVCNLMGTTTDKLTGKCKTTQSQSCFFTGHFIKTTCTPNSSGCPKSQKNITTGKAACPPKSTTQKTGDYSWSFNESCGKKCSRTINARQEFFICTFCTGN